MLCYEVEMNISIFTKLNKKTKQRIYNLCFVSADL